MNHSTVDDSLPYLDATVLAQMIASSEVSAQEVMGSFLARIDGLNSKVNAICTLLPADQAMAMAEQADNDQGNGKPLGPLHGLPIACKDLALTRGIRTTFGSPLFAQQVPDNDALFVQRLKAAGALVIGKTNTPEFGAGSHTFNPIFGMTHNPYDPSKSAGGSSGGAAAALAARLLPIADGSDMGGSLRNPAAFCNVVGFRPSIGRVPHWPSVMAWQSRLGVEGPMARNVDDLGLLLSVMAGPDQRDPLSIAEPPGQFADLRGLDTTGLRIAWSPDLGTLPVESAVVDVCQSALPHFEKMGCRVSEAHPDMSRSMDVFRVLRASYYGLACREMLAKNRDQLKSTLIENTEAGLALSADDVLNADVQRTELYYRVLQFFEDYDFLVLPTTQVVPFDHRNEWVTEINGVEMRDYIEWMSICCMITVTGLPAISMPCGFTDEGLPVGLQIVGKPLEDRRLLQLARCFEQSTQFARTLPSLHA